MINYKSFFYENGEDSQRSYWGDKAAGCIFVAKDTGRILLAHRSCEVGYEPETWGTWGGKIDMDETPKQAVEREVEEETGLDTAYKISPLYIYHDGSFEYHNFLVVVPFEFTPQLNWENDGSAWVEYGEWPDPLHFGMEALIRHSGHKIKNVVDLIKKKQDNMLESMDATPHFHKPTIRIKKVQQVKENMGSITLSKRGLVDDGIYGYELKSPQSYLRYGVEPTRNQFYLYNIGTPNEEDKNKGYAKALLEHFFQIIKQANGTLDTGPFTTSGNAYIKHVVERLAKEYGIRIV